MTKRFLCVLAAALCSVMSVAVAGNFGVSPIRLDLDRNAKTGSISVTNDNDEKLQVQMRAFIWRQDDTGKDVYEETADLIFFPKLMSLEKGETRVIRAGYKVPAIDSEKTYRLFIEEIPTPGEKKAGPEVAVSIRFGVPIFLQPIKPEPRGQIDRVELRDGALHVGVSNTGNVHLIINSVSVKTDAGLETSAKGWYLLNGKTRTHRLEVPGDLCANARSMSVLIKTDKTALEQAVDLSTAGCAR